MPPRQRDSKLRVHVQESKNSLDVFLITQERLRAMLTAHPDIGESVAFSFGNDRQSLDQGIADAEVMLVGNFETDELRKRAPQLKWVQSIFAGVEKLAPHIPEGITLTNASGVHAPKAGEYAICSILMLNSFVLRFIELQREKRWEPIFTPVVAGKTVLILGTGKMGIATAQQAKHFGMRVLGVSRSGAPQSPFDEVFPVSWLHDALPQAQFVVSILPNTLETRKLFGAREFAALPAGAGFVSIGRGQSIDEAAMIEALRSGRLSGAILDVFEEEPLPPQSPLWSMNNVVISAHCAVDDLESYLQRSIDIFADNVRRYLGGKSLDNVIDTKLGY